MEMINGLTAKFAPTLAGVSGAGLLAITPGTLQDAGQLLITLTTVICQLFAIFRKKKTNNNNSNSLTYEKEKQL